MVLQDAQPSSGNTTLSITTFSIKSFSITINNTWHNDKVLLPRVPHTSPIHWESLCWMSLCWVPLCWMSWRQPSYKCKNFYQIGSLRRPFFKGPLSNLLDERKKNNQCHKNFFSSSLTCQTNKLERFPWKNSLRSLTIAVGLRVYT
jgi:hypothetical protein